MEKFRRRGHECDFLSILILRSEAECKNAELFLM
jgi:hypothetical protein